MKRIKIRKRQKQEIQEVIEEMFAIADKTEVPNEPQYQEWDKQSSKNKMNVALESREAMLAIRTFKVIIKEIYKDNRP